MKIPKWFVVGSKVWFCGFGQVMEIIEIDDGSLWLDPKKESGFWIGRNIDGEHILPLEQIEIFWRPYHVDFRNEEE